MPWDWNVKMSSAKAAKLAEYFATEIPNPTTGSNLGLSFPGALHPLQDRWLGLSAEIVLAEQKIERFEESPDLELAYKELAELERRQSALELLLRVKNLPKPDPDSWRHPGLPDGWRERYEKDLVEFPRKTQAEMPKKTRSQTGEGAKKGKPKKGRAIHPKPVRIKK